MIGLPSGAPFPITYRELWLPPGINENASLPTSVEGGHGLAFTGARRGTTADGVHGIDGVATSNINLGAIHNAENILYIKIRFKLDQPFSIAAATDQYLFGKYDGPNDYLIGWLEADDGMFHMAHAEGGAPETIVSVEDTWDIGWHVIFVSLHNVNGQRLRVDASDAVVEAGNTLAISLAADFCLLARDDGVSTEGLAGIEVDVVMGIAALTVAQEYDLINGPPPAAATESYLLDEGRGVTSYDRGSGGNDGALDSSCTWAYGQVEQPIISFDSLNDHAQSSAGVDISGDAVLVWVGKIKANMDALGKDLNLCKMYIDADNNYGLYYSTGRDELTFDCVGNGINSRSIGSKPLIDSYIIYLCVADGNTGRFYANGTLMAAGPATSGARAGGAAIAYIARRDLVSGLDINKPLLIALIDGAFTPKQVRAYSRYLKNVFNLPISI